MRATFRPCSASGMAQPRITSSTSAGDTPGARESASRITTDAMSSGRITLSVPFGALPTAVRTAETITASCMGLPFVSFPTFVAFVWRMETCDVEAAEQILNGVAYL